MIDEEQVNSKKIHCEGKDSYSGHPRVFLVIPSGTDHIVCPYCSKKFIYKHNDQSN